MSEKECLTQLISLIEHFNNGGLDFNATDIVAIKYLLSKNKKYKEVIDKLKELIIDNIEETTYEYIGSNKIKALLELRMDNYSVNELLDILKEVE